MELEDKTEEDSQEAEQQRIEVAAGRHFGRIGRCSQDNSYLRKPILLYLIV